MPSTETRKEGAYLQNVFSVNRIWRDNLIVSS